jgi:hypothetical protein
MINRCLQLGQHTRSSNKVRNSGRKVASSTHRLSSREGSPLHAILSRSPVITQVVEGGDGLQMCMVKVKLSLCLTKHHAMEKYWGSEGITTFTLNLGNRWS